MIARKLQARVGVIGDVHAEDRLLERALRTLSAAGATATLCVGDLADGTGSLGRSVQLLRDANAHVVRGNHERWLLGGTMRDVPNATDLSTLSAEEQKYLADIPVTLEFSTPFGGLLLCHGMGPNDMAKVTPDDYGYALESNDELQKLIADPRIRFVVNGHSHRAMVRHFPELTVINAGTLKADNDPCSLLIDFDAGEVSLFTWERDAFVLHHVDALEPR
jgi:predicted phosphodiesterase